MKILVVHYRYFVSGGPERYMFNIMEVLSKHGHEVVPFSIKHNKNKFSKYDKYFMDAIGEGNEVYGHEYKKDFNTLSKVLFRMIYSFEAKKKFKKVLAEEKPDLIYLLQFQNKISCSIVDVAHSLKVPMVQRISDFAHICINNVFYNYKKSSICERCLVGSKVNAVKYKCWQKSLVNSVVKAFALKVQNIRGTTKKISAYVVPSRFTLTKYLDFGIPNSKLHHIPTFATYQTNRLSNLSFFEPYFLYVGRIEEEKGLFTLVKAFVDNGRKLIVIGFSGSGYDQYLQQYLSDKVHSIQFLGQLRFDKIAPYLAGALCTICPSEWYDNFPNVILESYAYQKAVIASNIGSLKELVVDGETGFLFKTGSSDDLNRCIKFFVDNPQLSEEMGIKALAKLQNEYSEHLHYFQLMNVFNKTVDEHKAMASLVKKETLI